jgi:hypothetical protein
MSSMKNPNSFVSSSPLGAGISDQNSRGVTYIREVDSALNRAAANPHYVRMPDAAQHPEIFAGARRSPPPTNWSDKRIKLKGEPESADSWGR